MAVVDYFLKIDGIDGEAQDKTHKNEIQLESWSFGETNAGTAGMGLGMGAGKVGEREHGSIPARDQRNVLVRQLVPLKTQGG